MGKIDKIGENKDDGRHRIGIRIDPELKERVKKYAENNNTTISKLILEYLKSLGGVGDKLPVADKDPVESRPRSFFTREPIEIARERHKGNND